MAKADSAQQMFQGGFSYYDDLIRQDCHPIRIVLKIVSVFSKNDSPEASNGMSRNGTKATRVTKKYQFL